MWDIGIMAITVDCRSTNRGSIPLYPESIVNFNLLYYRTCAGELKAKERRKPNFKISYTYADLAQLAEQLICNQQVEGSIPLVS